MQTSRTRRAPLQRTARCRLWSGVAIVRPNRQVLPACFGAKVVTTSPNNVNFAASTARITDQVVLVSRRRFGTRAAYIR